MKKAFLFLLISIKGGILFAQTSDTTESKVQVIEDEKITQLVTKYILLNSQSKTIPGYRIQIHFGGEREKAKEVKTKFLKSFPEMGAYESYQQPNFRIRVGDFRTKLEAQKFLKDISPTFTSSFIVNDEIHYPSLD